MQNGADDFVISEGNGDLFHVKFDTGTYFPDGRAFATSETILVFGENNGGIFHAQGVRMLAH